jgi:hypothetical protein
MVRLPGTMSQPITPGLGASIPSSAISSASSRRNSLVAISSGYPESRVSPDDVLDGSFQNPSTSDSAPQLIMPTLAIPSRRPFTDTGKAMGRLKILFAGSSGKRPQSSDHLCVSVLENVI